MYVKYKDSTTNIIKTLAMNFSRTVTVVDVQREIAKAINKPSSSLRILFGGKILNPKQRLFECGYIEGNALLYLIRSEAAGSSSTPSCSAAVELSPEAAPEPGNGSLPDADVDSELTEVDADGLKTPAFSISKFYELGDVVYLVDCKTGALDEAKIVDIREVLNNNDETTSVEEQPSTSRVIDLPTDPVAPEEEEEFQSFSAKDKDFLTPKVVWHRPMDSDNLIYTIRRDIVEGMSAREVEEDVKLCNLRPAATRQLPLDEVEVGMKCAVYMAPLPGEPYAWYECVITQVTERRQDREVKAAPLMGTNGELQLPSQNVKYKHSMLPLLAHLHRQTSGTIFYRDNAYTLEELCEKCLEHPTRGCTKCCCRLCGKKDDAGSQLLCDECNMAFHMACLNPPITAVPEESWFCPRCYRDPNVVLKAGQQIKSKKLENMRSASSKKDWGKGNATRGVESTSMVPSNHSGPVPLVEVGMTWLYRFQVSATGVHRPPIAGIAGRAKECAYSVVLAGGYEGEQDHGDWFTYTGSGGRDLSGNKRVAGQSSDQELSTVNLALARSCDVAEVNVNKSGKARDWMKGKPIRVLRKAGSHSEFAPEQGYRYDGIYKVTKYYPTKSKEGHRLWQFELRRDDPVPAPWTKEGKKRILELGISEMMVPPECGVSKKNEGQTPNIQGKKRKGGEDESQELSAKKKKKPPPPKPFKLDKEVNKLIKEDLTCAKKWEEVLPTLQEGKLAFLRAVLEAFRCPVCQELVCHPMVLSCEHTVCQGCLKRHLAAADSENPGCPMCRAPLPKQRQVNDKLFSVLKTFYNGYTAERC